MYPAKVT